MLKNSQREVRPAELVLGSHGELGFCKVCLKQNLIWTLIPADAFKFKVVAPTLLTNFSQGLGLSCSEV